MGNQLKIVIVDDHQIVIDGLKLLLHQVNDIDIIGEANSGEQLLEMLGNGIVPDILILDLILPGLSGVDILKRINEEYTGIKIIIFTGNSPDQMVVSALEEGALGILPKNSTRAEFVKAIKEVQNGQQYFGELITNDIIKAFLKKTNGVGDFSDSSLDLLTPREVDIVKLISDGLSAKEIAYDLKISTHTVETHKNNILRKLNLRSSIDLVKFAIKTGLVDL